MKRYWAIADIHGEYALLLRLFDEMQKNGFDFEKGDVIVQLGDRNDRGPDTYSINEWFKTQQLMWKGQVICLMGNHDRMLIDAALGRSDLMYWNGGQATEKSYSKITGIYGKNGLGNSLMRAGHWDWLRNLPTYYETDQYFFSHAPIPKEQYRDIPVGSDFRLDEHTLTWSYNDLPERKWIDPNLIPIAEDGNYQGNHKICCYGHIHGMSWDAKNLKYRIPGVRKYGNAILLDTGAGCSKEGYLTCIRLPDLLVMNSNGESYQLKDTEDSTYDTSKEIPDDKVQF